MSLLSPFCSFLKFILLISLVFKGIALTFVTAPTQLNNLILIHLKKIWRRKNDATLTGTWQPKMFLRLKLLNPLFTRYPWIYCIICINVKNKSATNFSIYALFFLHQGPSSKDTILYHIVLIIIMLFNDLFIGVWPSRAPSGPYVWY